MAIYYIKVARFCGIVIIFVDSMESLCDSIFSTNGLSLWIASSILTDFLAKTERGLIASLPRKDGKRADCFGFL